MWPHFNAPLEDYIRQVWSYICILTLHKTGLIIHLYTNITDLHTCTCSTVVHPLIRQGPWVAQWVRSDLTAHTSLSPIWHGFAPSFVNYKKGALYSQPQVIKFTSCLPMVGGSLWLLRLPPPLKLVAMI
jgi:hypothetical protein